MGERAIVWKSEKIIESIMKKPPKINSTVRRPQNLSKRADDTVGKEPSLYD